MVGRNVEQLGVGAVGCRLLVLGPERSRADPLRVAVFTIVLGRIRIDHQRPAVGLGRLVHVDLGRPVHGRIVLFCDQQFAGCAIERIAEAVTVEMGQQLPRLAADGLIAQDHLIDAIEVPFIVRRHLVDPLGLTGVEIACKYRHRPLVITGALHRVPGRGVARTVVDQIQLGIVGIPAPGGAATDLPLIALPGGVR